MLPFTIRPAHAGDTGLIFALLRELADYEKLLDKFDITEADIARDFLGENPAVFCELGYAGGEAAGIITWHWLYATFPARRGLFLADLFVRPAFRGRGYAKAFLAHLAKKGAAVGAHRLEWQVLDWNAPALRFYESIGARRFEGWSTYRLDAPSMAALAAP